MFFWGISAILTTENHSGKVTGFYINMSYTTGCAWKFEVGHYVVMSTGTGGHVNGSIASVKNVIICQQWFVMTFERKKPN